MVSQGMITFIKVDEFFCIPLFIVVLLLSTATLKKSFLHDNITFIFKTVPSASFYISLAKLVHQGRKVFSKTSMTCQV